MTNITALQAQPVTLIDWVQALAHSLERTRQPDGSYHCALSSSQHWDAVRDNLTQIVYAAHNDELPNNWRYETTLDIAEHVLAAALLEPAQFDVESIREMDWDIAESLSDSYTSDIFEWMTDCMHRTAWIDESLAAEMLSGQFQTDFSSLARLRQQEEIVHMVHLIATGLEALAR